MKIAVVGAGVSGLVAALRLTELGHDVTVFEAGESFGGHAQSVSLETLGVHKPIETGFLVFNKTTCPHLASLVDELDAPTRPIRMMFEVCDSGSARVFRGATLPELMANALKGNISSMHRVIPDWLRFVQYARRQITIGVDSSVTLERFLHEGDYSDAFAQQFILPLAGAVNPAPGRALPELPLASLLAFIGNHGLLRLTTEPQACSTLAEGSEGYLRRLTASFAERIQLSCPVSSIARDANHVLLKFPHRSRERFEHVVLAVHADAALQLLADPTRCERQVLSSFEYSPQVVYIHREQEKRTGDGATWRFQPTANGLGSVSLSYGIAAVQDVDAPESLALTMHGADHGPPTNVLRRVSFRRPVFSTKSLEAQRRFGEINGRRRTYFCGSYWGHGFHEDAVQSAEDIAQRMAKLDRSLVGAV